MPVACRVSELGTSACFVMPHLESFDLGRGKISLPAFKPLKQKCRKLEWLIFKIVKEALHIILQRITQFYLATSFKSSNH